MYESFKSPESLRLFHEKLFYKIGEASKIVGVETHVLRYWETEFPFLMPRKTKSGQRIYTKKDIDLILQIKRLLYDEKYTIDGARRKLSSNLSDVEIEESEKTEERNDSNINAVNALMKVKERLREMLKSLK